MSQRDTEKYFFGRTEILDLIRRRVRDLKEGYRQNIAIVGDRYLGKTALVRYFLENHDDGDVIPIYLEMEDKDTAYFFYKFAGSLLYNYSKVKQLPLYDDLALLLESTKDQIPMTTRLIEEIKGYLQAGKVADAFIGLLTLPEVFSYETGKYTLLILDEFQHFETWQIPQIFQILGKHIMTKKRCLYVVTSSYPATAKKILGERLSLLFGNFEVITLEAFDSSTSQKYIEHHLTEIKIGAQINNFLTDFTGGHPLYLNLLCREMISLCAIHRQNEVYMPVLAQAVENSLFDRWGVISRHFELLVEEFSKGKGQEDIPSLMLSLANGNHKIDELLKDLSLKRPRLQQMLQALIAQGSVVKNGNFYCLKDKLVKYWLKYVYQKRLKDVDFAWDRQRKRFKEEFHRSVEDFKTTTRKDLCARIMELFHCFDNESFDLNGRRYKLPIFRNIAAMKIRNQENNNLLDTILALTEATSWYIILKKDNFIESDVTAVLQEVKLRERRLERCVVICLSDIEENTKLRALQEGFWIWSERELNTLLNLFEKPFIMR